MEQKDEELKAAEVDISDPLYYASLIALYAETHRVNDG